MCWTCGLTLSVAAGRCFWREHTVLRNANATCVRANFLEAIRRRNSGCYDACAQPRNSSTPARRVLARARPSASSQFSWYLLELTCLRRAGRSMVGVNRVSCASTYGGRLTPHFLPSGQGTRRGASANAHRGAGGARRLARGHRLQPRAWALSSHATKPLQPSVASKRAPMVQAERALHTNELPSAWASLHIKKKNSSGSSSADNQAK